MYCSTWYRGILTCNSWLNYRKFNCRCPMSKKTRFFFKGNCLFQPTFCPCNDELFKQFFPQTLPKYCSTWYRVVITRNSWLYIRKTKKKREGNSKFERKLKKNHQHKQKPRQKERETSTVVCYLSSLSLSPSQVFSFLLFKRERENAVCVR